jgi:protein-arginine deiminase
MSSPTLLLAAMLAAAPVHALTVDLAVDTDRDGAVTDADDAGEDRWTPARGAIFAVNYDRDGERTGSGGLPVTDVFGMSDGTAQQPGLQTDVDRRIENAADVLDLAPLVVTISGPIPDGARVVLRAAELEDVQSMQVYVDPKAGAEAVWGGLGSRLPGGEAQPLEVDLTPLVAGGGSVTLGIEGLLYRFDDGPPHQAFDGEIDLTLAVEGAGEPVTDSVRLRVAPWIALPHTQPSTRTFVADVGAQNATFRKSAEADAGYAGVDASGTVVEVPVDPENPSHMLSPFLQDHVELGFHQRPGAPPTPSALSLPEAIGEWPRYENSRWPLTHLLAPDVAVFQLGAFLGPDAPFVEKPGAAVPVSGSYGGSLEAMPPTPAHPLGRILVADTMSPRLVAFLRAQEVQAPVEIPSRWTRSGHLDEAFGFTAKPGVAVVADPTLAYALLEDRNLITDPDTAVFFAPNATAAVAKITAAPEGTRLDVVLDPSAAWLRVVDGEGAGQVAAIAQVAGDHVRVSRVFDLPRHFVPAAEGEPGWLDVAFDGVPPMKTAAGPSDDPWFRAPAAGDRVVAVPTTHILELQGQAFTPAFVTVSEVLADERLRKLNQELVKPRLEAVKQALLDAAGGPGSLRFVSVPVIFVGTPENFEEGRSAVAFTPNLANFQVAGGRHLFPRQWGPKGPDGRDVFEDATRQALAGEGIDATFVDDWFTYHRRDGDVHCGTLVQREPWPEPWWTKLQNAGGS